jgi:hypothetical protein
MTKLRDFYVDLIECMSNQNYILFVHSNLSEPSRNLLSHYNDQFESIPVVIYDIENQPHPTWLCTVPSMLGPTGFHIGYSQCNVQLEKIALSCIPPLEDIQTESVFNIKIERETHDDTKKIYEALKQARGR